jgi:hypothetical protein
MKHALLTLTTLLGLPSAAMAIDLDLYAALLAEYTSETRDLAGVRVDYEGLRSSPRWAELVRSLESSDPSTLGTRNERLAFWCNAYNILAIDLVVTHAPRESITDIGSFFSPVWKKTAGNIGGKPYSLDDIEHEIVRPMGEPRTHVALICASLSCPPLLREPWRGENLDAQLDAQVRIWLQHRDKGLRLDRDRKSLHLSSIFDWFGEDFEAHGGVLDFVTAHAPADDATWLREHGDEVRIHYLDYDWNLNALER